VVEQLPVIKQQLRSIKERFSEETAKAMEMECTEDTLKEIRAIRAHISKIFKALEDKRKAAKKAILAPYEDFEQVYKECVTDIYKPCDEELAKKIAEVENSLKAAKRADAQEYFNEYAKSLMIDFVTLDRIGLNITLNASKKSIRTQIKDFLDRVNDELQLIETQPHSAEILVEYKISLNVAQAITRVSERHKAIEEEQRRREAAQAVVEKTAAVVKAVDEVVDEVVDESTEFAPPTAEIIPETPQEEETVAEKTYSTTFTVRGTLPMLKALKEFLNNGGYEYECE
ncbi:MAG: DUF1351 domain-containing protein, partial [Ruminiclostridium sp.]|nr:DUF1351 domain-containing protein [Ruminiclostridium sp.]